MFVDNDDQPLKIFEISVMGLGADNFMGGADNPVRDWCATPIDSALLCASLFPRCKLKYALWQKQ